MQTRLLQAQKMEAIETLAGGIAHRYNNQLSIVTGNLELAMFELPPASSVCKKLIDAMKAAYEAAEISNMILTYLGQTSGKKEPVDLSETCRRNLRRLQLCMPEKVDLQVELPSPGPIVQANVHQIQQVLNHLTVNAWEAADDGRDTIHVTVKTVLPADIPAANRFPPTWQPRDGLYACLEVRDGGCGIAENHIEKIFDPFFTNKSIGRGLGLSAVLGIVRGHSGAVTVASRWGSGSIFRIFLPASAVEILKQPDTAEKAPKMAACSMVLLVEDDPLVRKMTHTMLTRLGFTVIEAKDGAEAVDVFRKHQDAISLVLSDLIMPHMDGWTMLDALRRLVPGIPVILSSGCDQDQVMNGEHAEWPNVFLGKPYCFAELCDAISQAMEVQIDNEFIECLF